MDLLRRFLGTIFKLLLEFEERKSCQNIITRAKWIIFLCELLIVDIVQKRKRKPDYSI